jgi:ATP-dependent exoDNAse (exonuclease V) beta subunit
VNSLLPVMRHWLRQQGHAAHMASEAAARVQQLLTTTLSSAEGQWVLDAHEEASVELALMQLTVDEAKQHIVDRTFIAGGARWIIDYKTTALDVDASPEALSSAAENYRQQLESYAGLFKQEGLPVRCAVFFMHIGKLVELAVD